MAGRPHDEMEEAVAQPLVRRTRGGAIHQNGDGGSFFALRAGSLAGL